MALKKSITPRLLDPHGVELLDPESAKAGIIFLRCQVCGARWSPMLQGRGRLPSRFWVCPAGCNDNGSRIGRPRKGAETC